MADEKYNPFEDDAVRDQGAPLPDTTSTYRFTGDGGHLVFGNDRAIVPMAGPEIDLRLLDDREFAILRGLMQLATERVASESLRRGVASAGTW